MSAQTTELLCTVAAYTWRYPCPYCGEETTTTYPARVWNAAWPGADESSRQDQRIVCTHGNATATFTYAQMMAGGIDDWVKMLDRITTAEQVTEAEQRWNDYCTGSARAAAGEVVAG